MSIDLSASVLVVLAAGESSRFGSPKGLAAVRGRPLIAWSVARFRQAGGRRVVVVVGAHEESYRVALAGEATLVVANRNLERGPFHSLQLGLAAAQAGPDGALFVLPVDVPAPDPQVWRMLAKSDKGLAAVVPTTQGHGGHPVRLSAAFCVQLLEIPWNVSDARLDLRIRSLPEDLRERVAVADPTIRANLNTPEAFSAWEESLDKTPSAHNS